MKRAFYLVVVLGLLVQQGIWFAPASVQASSPASPLNQAGDEPVARPTDEPLAPPPDVTAAEDITVPYPEPSQPIPYNKPGYPSKMGIDTRLRLATTYQPWAASVSAMSTDQATQALSYSADIDPFASNYNLVDWDSVSVITPDNGRQRFRAWKGKEAPTTDINLTSVMDGYSSGGDTGFTRTGDVNNDGIDEVVTVSGGKVQVGNFGKADSAINLRTNKGAPAIASPREGTDWQFARGYDDQLWMLRGANWEPLGGNLVSAPTASSPEVDRVDVLMLQADNHIWRCLLTKDKPGCDWSPQNDDWGAAPSGYYFVGEPAMVAPSPNVHDVFARGSDNTLWHRAWRDGWSAWMPLGGYITSSPAVTLQGEKIVVAAVGYDGAIWTMSRAVGGGDWSAWERVPGDLQFTTAPAIVSPGPGMLDLYAVDPNLDADDVPHPVLKMNRFRSTWQGWTETLPAADPGGEPVSAPAATMLRGTTMVEVNYLGASGYVLASGGDWLAFWNMPPLGVWSRQYPIDNFWDFELGHFLPNGRMQAIAYRLDFGGQPSTTKLLLEPFRFDAGFGPQPMIAGGKPIEITLNHPASSSGWWFMPAVGDFEGDGVEEFSLMLQSGSYADLYLFKLAYDDQGELTVTDKASKLTLENASGHWLNLNSGDYDGDGQDELAVLRRIDGDGCYLSAHNVTASAGQYTIAKLADADKTDCLFNKAMGMASGNFIGAGEDTAIRDEIVYAGVQHQITFLTDHFHLRRYIVRLENGNLVTKDVVQENDVLQRSESDAEPNFEVRVTAANLHRNGTERAAILLKYGKVDRTWPLGPMPGARNLYVYAYENGQLADKGWWVLDGNLYDAWVPGAFVSGNLTGEGLRVAKPTYRLAANVGKLVARVSAPPKIYDVNYNNPNNPDDPHVVNPESLATITLTSEAKKQITVEAKSHWNLDAELTAQAGDDDVGPRVSASLKGSVGQDFSNVAGSSQTVSQNSVITSPVDQWVYALTDFQMFEYPVIDGETGDQWNMSVTTPMLGSVGMSVSGLNCDVLLNPGHELNNLLSYASVPKELPGFKDNKYLGTNISYDASSGGEFSALFTNGTDSTFSQSTDWSVTAGIEAGYSGGVGSISASLEGTYSEGYAATESVSTSNSIGVGGTRQQLGPADAIYYQHKIQPYFYWTSDKTLVLDYVVETSDTTWWKDPNGWLLPDLAFVRPRKGLPCSPAQGQNQDDLSPDISFDNATPLAGSPVKVTALVHNFSNQSAPIGVTVKFYKGDPALGGTELCSKTDSLSGRGQTAVTCDFTVSGFGEQRIYAEVRPTVSTVKERDVTNNKAFGVLTVVVSSSSANNADPGLIDRKEGLLLELDSGGGKQTRFFAPYLALSNLSVTSFKLEPASAQARSFEITAVRVNENGAWTSVEQTFGLNGSGTRDHSIPTAWVSVEYTDADLGDVREEDLTLWYYNEVDRTWEKESDRCRNDLERDPVVRDPGNNVLQAPVCRTGTFALFEISNGAAKVYLPLIRR
jgi:hypothetical protein